MAHFLWNGNLDTGMDEFDEFHRRIMDYADTLFDAVKYNDREKVGVTLDRLLEYCISVFAYEETIISQTDYPSFAEHKAVHENFTGKIADYRERHYRGEDVSRRLLSDLKIWITNHVYRDDKAYVPYVRKRFSIGWFKRLCKRCA